MNNQPSVTLIAAPAHPSAAILAAYLIAERNSTVITAEQLNYILQTPVEGPEIIALFIQDRRDFFRSLGYTGDMRGVLREFKNDAYRYLHTLVKDNSKVLDNIVFTFVLESCGRRDVTPLTLRTLIYFLKPDSPAAEISRLCVECLRELDPHLHSLIVD